MGIAVYCSLSITALIPTFIICLHNGTFPDILEKLESSEDIEDLQWYLDNVEFTANSLKVGSVVNTGKCNIAYDRTVES